MTIKNNKKFADPFHPGEILLHEFIIPNDWTQIYVAEQLDWTRARLNELINEKRGITVDAALHLPEFLGTTPEIWLNMQMAFDLDRAIKRRNKVV